jgi:hypothetical protein
MQTARQANDLATSEQLYRFRYHEIVKIQGISHPEADHSRGLLRESLDDSSTSFGLWDGDVVVASLRVTCVADLPAADPLIDRLDMRPAVSSFGARAVFTSSRFILRRGSVSPKGAFRLLDLAYSTLWRRNARLVFGDCSKHLVRFYEHMGYRLHGKSFLDPVFGRKFPLILLPRDHEWLVQRRSPLVRCALRYPADPEVLSWLHQRIK